MAIETNIGMHGIRAAGIKKQSIKSEGIEYITTTLVLVHDDYYYTEINLYRADLDVQVIPAEDTALCFVHRLKERDTCSR